MSVVSNYYVIAGYDLTGLKTDKFNDWKWTEEGEDYTHYQRKGYIQLFDDPMNNSHLYLGYVLASGDEYDFVTAKINLNDVLRQEPYVYNKLKQLIDKNVICDVFNSKDLNYEVIVFEECT